MTAKHLTGDPDDDPILRDLPFQVAFEVTIADGATGKRLAVRQAEAILDVLTWCHRAAVRRSGNP